jgi:hypothetical protein
MWPDKHAARVMCGKQLDAEGFELYFGKICGGFGSRQVPDRFQTAHMSWAFAFAFASSSTLGASLIVDLT